MLRIQRLKRKFVQTRGQKSVPNLPNILFGFKCWSKKEKEKNHAKMLKVQDVFVLNIFSSVKFVFRQLSQYLFISVIHNQNIKSENVILHVV